MLEIDVPGYRKFRLDHLVLDYNGTLACDGGRMDGVRESLRALSDRLEIHVLTADTFGKAESELEGVPCTLSILPIDEQDAGKRDYVRELGADVTAAVGNGRNDRLMLKEAALGISVIQAEGAAVETLMSGDVVCCSILDAFDLLLNPLRLVATLRS